MRYRPFTFISGQSIDASPCAARRGDQKAGRMVSSPRPFPFISGQFIDASPCAARRGDQKAGRMVSSPRPFLICTAVPEPLKPEPCSARNSPIFKTASQRFTSAAQGRAEPPCRALFLRRAHFDADIMSKSFVCAAVHPRQAQGWRVILLIKAGFPVRDSIT